MAGKRPRTPQRSRASSNRERGRSHYGATLVTATDTTTSAVGDERPERRRASNDRTGHARNTLEQDEGRPAPGPFADTAVRSLKEVRSRQTRMRVICPRHANPTVHRTRRTRSEDTTSRHRRGNRTASGAPRGCARGRLRPTGGHTDIVRVRWAYAHLPRRRDADCGRSGAQCCGGAGVQGSKDASLSGTADDAHGEHRALSI